MVLGARGGGIEEQGNRGVEVCARCWASGGRILDAGVKGGEWIDGELEELRRSGGCVLGRRVWRSGDSRGEFR